METATSVLRVCSMVAIEVYGRLQQLSENNEHRRLIESHVLEMKMLTDELQEMGQDELPDSWREFMSNFKDALEDCSTICSTLHRKSSIKKFIASDDHRKLLVKLENRLKNAKENLHLALTQATYMTSKQSREQADCNARESRKNTFHPMAGVYLGGGESCPEKIKKPEVALDESHGLMVVTWNDDVNSAEAVSRYEIRYDDETDEMVAAEPQQFSDANGSKFRCKLGPPRIRLGHLYTLRIRAANGAGPGRWSDAVNYRFKYGPPNRPRKPTFRVQSPTEILIGTKRLLEREENGCPASQCIVEYIEKDDSSDSSWKSNEYDIDHHDRNQTFPMSDLKPDTIYYVRIRMVNSSGQSKPSEKIEAFTTELIPGPPEGVYVSLVEADVVEIHWRSPKGECPAAVYSYVAQKRRVKSKKLDWFDFQTVERDKFSARATGLKTNTEYQFRVQAINSNGKGGGYSNEIIAKTALSITVCAEQKTAAACADSEKEEQSFTSSDEDEEEPVAEREEKHN